MRQRLRKSVFKVAALTDDSASILFLALAMATLLTAMIALPTFAVMPIIASTAFACAMLFSLAAYWSDCKEQDRSLSDLAGAFALVGVAAAIFSGPAEVVETFAYLAQ